MPSVSPSNALEAWWIIRMLMTTVGLALLADGGELSESWDRSRHGFSFSEFGTLLTYSLFELSVCRELSSLGRRDRGCVHNLTATTTTKNTSSILTVYAAVTTSMQILSNSLVSSLVFDSTRGLLNFRISGPLEASASSMQP